MIPAHKQTDPNKKPGQIVNPVSGRKEDTTLGDYINRKYRDEAFSAVAAERKECCGNPLRGCMNCPPPKKLSFEEWYEKQGVHLDPACEEYRHEFQLCWQAAQENK